MMRQGLSQLNTSALTLLAFLRLDPRPLLPPYPIVKNCTKGTRTLSVIYATLQFLQGGIGM